ncbi:MAG: tetratricopeptide repeat protein [Sphingobacteriaceae bacterium]|nr:tetratricopeptide repeat protein [Sphingobacteriaceae bacterium]
MLFVFVLVNQINGQNQVCDSLNIELKKAVHDSDKCRLLSLLVELDEDEEKWVMNNEILFEIAANKLKTIKNDKVQEKLYKGYFANALNNKGFYYRTKGDLKLAKDYFQKSIKIQFEIQDKKGIAANYNNIASILLTNGENMKAMAFLEKSIAIKKEIGDLKGMANSLLNLASIYDDLGQIPKAIEMLDQSLKIYESLNDLPGTARVLNNLGAMHKGQDQLNKALDCFEKCVAIRTKIKDKRGVAWTYANIGSVYYGLKQMDKAKEYADKSLKLKLELNDEEGIALSYDISATMKSDEKRYDEALLDFEKCLNIMERLGNKQVIAITNNKIGALYYILKSYSKAKYYCTKSLELGKELGQPERIANAAHQLYLIEKMMGQPKKALEHYEQYVRMSDSVSNEITKRASIKSQLKYEYEKQAAADSVAHAKESEVKNAELAKQSAEIKAKKNQQYALFGGLALVMIFAGFMYNRFKITQKQKLIIEMQKLEVEDQKLLVEEKQKEVLDSIRYAQRIQQAHIPSDRMILRFIQRTKM